MRQAGLSVIEVLIAALLFLIIMLGTLPLFTQAMTSNTSGGLSTDNASDIKDAIEFIYQTPWDQVAAGERVEIHTLEEDKWVVGDTPPSGETLRGTRTTTIRDYHISALDDGILAVDEKLEGADPFWVNLKEIEVNIDGEASGALASTQNVTHRVLRSQ